MFLGSNLQYLRKISNSMTQEKLAEYMGVSRQTVSKWESGEAYPELPKLMDLCEILHCTLDDLLRRDLAAQAEIYRSVQIVKVAGFRRAQYVMISANPREDVRLYMDRWASASGLSEIPGFTPTKIGWNFPYVTAEQKNRFGLKGYVCACILPEGFTPDGNGIQLVEQGTAEYAVITIRDPFADTYNRIPQAYHQIFEYLSVNGFRKKHSADVLPCFERFYEKDGLPYMDIFVHCDSAGNAKNLLSFI